MATDYGLSHWGSAIFGSAPNTSFPIDARHAIELNAAGLTNLSTTAGNVVGMRSQHDFDDVAPVTFSGSIPSLHFPAEREHDGRCTIDHGLRTTMTARSRS